MTSDILRVSAPQKSSKCTQSAINSASTTNKLQNITFQ